MDVTTAIRRRRAVRAYADTPVDDAVLDRLLSLALRAPTGSGAQAWGLVVVRDDDRRRAIAELVMEGGARYFALMRPRREGAGDAEHAAWARALAAERLGTYPRVPVWIVGGVEPTRDYPDELASWGRDDDLMSLAFAFQNLMLAARAEGLGTVPTTAFWRFGEDRLRALLDIPDHVAPHLVTPLGYPEGGFPTGTAPAMTATYRRWRSLVHDETFGARREDPS